MSEIKGHPRSSFGEVLEEFNRTRPPLHPRITKTVRMPIRENETEHFEAHQALEYIIPLMEAMQESFDRQFRRFLIEFDDAHEAEYGHSPVTGKLYDELTDEEGYMPGVTLEVATDKRTRYVREHLSRAVPDLADYQADPKGVLLKYQLPEKMKKYWQVGLDSEHGVKAEEGDIPWGEFYGKNMDVFHDWINFARENMGLHFERLNPTKYHTDEFYYLYDISWDSIVKLKKHYEEQKTYLESFARE